MKWSCTPDAIDLASCEIAEGFKLTDNFNNKLADIMDDVLDEIEAISIREASSSAGCQ